MPNQEIKYRCDFCMSGRHDTIEIAAEHEKDCIMNPSAHGCKTCSNFCNPVGWTDRMGRFTGKSERCSKDIPLHIKFKTHCPEWGA